MLDPSGTGFDVGRFTAEPRRIDPAYQAAMSSYYGSGDAALFERLKSDAFPASTLDAIRRRLPTDGVLGSVTVMTDGGD